MKKDSKDIRPWPLIGRKELFTSPIVKLTARTSSSPRTGQHHTFFVAEMSDWVNIIPITEDRQVIMVQQFRHGTEEVTLEIPGGMVDPRDPSPAVAAVRELREETGYQANKVESLGTIAPNPAIQDNRCHSFLATELTCIGEQKLDLTEEIRILTIPLADIPALIRQGRICHSLVVVAFWFLFQASLEPRMESW